MKDAQIKFRLTEEMKTEIETLAKKKDIPASQLIREAVKRYIQEENK